MMLDLTQIPTRIIEDLKKRGHTEQDIQCMTPEQAFSEFCNWNALIGWGDSLWEAVTSLQQANSKAPLKAAPALATN